MNSQYKSKFVLRGILLYLVLILIPTLSWGYGFIQGYVRDNSEPPLPIEGARIETDYGFSAVSVSDGSYIMLHYAGTYNLTASALGFTSQSFEVTITDTITTTQDLSLPVSPLTIKSVSPNWEEMGNDLDVTINGTGFDGNTRVSLSPDAGNSAKIIGSINLYGSCGNTVSGSTAYVVTVHPYSKSSDLHVIDISDPTSPAIIDSVEMLNAGSSYGTYGVSVSDNIAYVANGSGGLQIIDVDTESLTYLNIIGSVETITGVRDVAIDGSTAYVAAGDSGLHVFDISDPVSPTSIGSFNTSGYAWKVAYANSKVYVADGGGGLQVIDVDPESSLYLTRTGWDSNIHATGVVVVGSTAFVAGWGDSGLQVMDITNPFPTPIGSVDTPGDSWSITVEGSTAYVADEYGGLKIIDVSNLSSPAIIGSVNTGYSVYDVKVVGNIAYVSDYRSLKVIDITNPTPPTIIGSIPTVTGSIGTNQWAHDVTVTGNTVYVANGDVGLKVIDVAPQSPSYLKIIGSVDTPGAARGVTVTGNIAYVADYGSLQVIDIADPANPTIIGSVGTSGIARGVTVTGSIAYVASGYNGGLQVIDVDPESPSYLTIIGSVATPGTALSVSVSGERAYVAASDSGLQVIDISDPTSPTIIDSVDIYGDTCGIMVQDSLAYVVDRTRGFMVIDIDPESSSYLDIIAHVYTPGSTYDLTVNGSIAYIADYIHGFHMFDISDPTSPTIIGSVDTPGFAQGIAVVNNIAYVAEGPMGLTIVPTPIEINPLNLVNDTEITGTLPSPPVAGNYTIRIFSSSGQSDELTAAVTFSDQMANTKAIIVAAGGPGEANNPNSQWEDMKINAHYAYNALLWQGYRKENIYYMSAEHYDGSVDIDGNGKADDVDQDATVANFNSAINIWAKNPSSPADNLLIYIIAHGYNGMFEMVRQDDYSENNYLKASDLEQWLDNLQGTMPNEAIVVYEACKSGSFLEPMGKPGAKRITIASSEMDKYATMLDNGKKSFSYNFWDSVYSSGSLKDAFNKGSAKMSQYQTSGCDADGDGLADSDTNLIANIAIGRNIKTLPGDPWIIRTCDSETLTGGSTSLDLWVEAGGDSPITEVRAVIKPPGYNAEQGGSSFASLPTIDLVPADKDGDGNNDENYFALNYSEFYIVGDYHIEFYAIDANSKESLPKSVSMNQTQGPDIYEQDDSSSQANIVEINSPDPQHHSFHAAGDQDWNMFYGISGQTYFIEAFNSGSNCDPVITLHDESLTVITTKNDTGSGGTEILNWTCPQDGIFYVKVTHASSGSGADTDYDLKIYQDNVAIPVALKGTILDNTNNPVSSAIIQIINTSDLSIKGSGISRSNGSYSLVLESGIYDIRITAAGYKDNTQAGVDFSSENVMDFTMLPIGTNTAPVADAGSDQVVFNSITLNAGQSSDPDADDLIYTWDIIHQINPIYNTIASGISPTLFDLAPGFYAATVTVTDPSGLSSSETIAFTATGPAVSEEQYNTDIADKDAVIAEKDLIITDKDKEIDGLAISKAYYLYGDFDADGDIDSLDLSRFGNSFGMIDINIFDDGDLDGFSEYEGDCNDYDDSVNPGADEICSDQVDNNCNGVIDEEPCN